MARGELITAAAGGTGAVIARQARLGTGDVVFSDIDIADSAAANHFTVDEATKICLGCHTDSAFVEAGEIAALTLYLASDAARPITAQSFSINSGFR